MIGDLLKQELEQEARTSLLQHYSRKCTAHGTNILTIAIGLFAYTQVYNQMSEILWIPLTYYINSLIIAAFINLGFHQIIRLMVWAQYTDKIMGIELDRSEARRNLLNELHVKCRQDFKGFWGYLSSARKFWLTILLLWAISWGVIFLILIWPK